MIILAADDPRHGTTRGFHAGCRCHGCRRAIARYVKGLRLRRVQGVVWAIPALGAQRRIQALMALGWTSSDIAEAAGWRNRNGVLRVLNGQGGKPCRWVERKTHQTIAEVFEQLAMRLPAHAPHRARTRALAKKKGYAPPLAWDDIDDPDEQPTTGAWQPVKNWPAAELLAEWEHFRSLGVSDHEAARKLGVTVEALERAALRQSVRMSGEAS